MNPSTEAEFLATLKRIATALETLATQACSQNDCIQEVIKQRILVDVTGELRTRVQS